MTLDTFGSYRQIEEVQVRVPTAAPTGRALLRPARRAVAAMAAVAVLVAVGAAALLAIRPPAARGADAPADAFSATRAYRHVPVVAAAVHAAGSPANDRVREHLVDTLRGLGLATEVQDTVGVEGGTLSSSAGGVGLARVRNVVATLAGTASTGRIFLVAHYDSIQTAPGGNDDGAGVATVLETARALTAGPRPRNDVVFVLTDAEEACLCGASAFVAQSPLARDRGVVLNLEARGRTGPAIMFETSARNAGLLQVYARTPHPVGTSFAVEIYRLMPNDTDFTPFRKAGFAGLNTAYIEGAAGYHTPLDTAAAMDTDSLQHHGDNALAMARSFGGADLSTVRADGDATYFPVPGGLAHHPGFLTVPLAVLALLTVGLLGVLARRSGRASGRRLAAGFALALVPIVVAPVLAQLLWALVTMIRPGYATLLDPYRPLGFRLAVLALTAAVLFAWYALLRRRIGPAALAIGGLGWLALIGVVLAALVPGGSYLATLPALAGSVAGIAALRLPGRWAVGATTVGAAVAVVVLLPTVVMLFPALGMGKAGAAAFLTALLGLAALPIVDLLHPAAGGQRGMDAARARRRGALPTLLAAAAAVLVLIVGLYADRFDAEHPVPTQLMYALDADTGAARWLSAETTVQAWTAQYVAGTPAPVVDTLPAFGSRKLLGGPAPAAALPPPSVTVLGDIRSGDRRTLRLRLVPQRQVRFVTLHVAAAGVTVAGVSVASATVAGRDVPVDRSAGKTWGFGFIFHAPPSDGVEVRLVLDGSGPVRLRAMDASDGLSGLPGFRPRPAGVGIAGSHTSELVAVARTYTF
jgi:hypothetical protein